MSKEIDLSRKIPQLVKYMEDNFKDEDGINKITILKTTAAYYDSLVAAESMKAIIIKTMGNIR